VTEAVQLLDGVTVRVDDRLGVTLVVLVKLVVNVRDKELENDGDGGVQPVAVIEPPENVRWFVPTAS
jgi:hypothetical protein